MKIRDGFVTNSSSTSYIILSKKELTGEYLGEKLGLKKDSLNYTEICKLCNKLVNNGKDGFYHHDYSDTNKDLVKEIFGEKTANMYQKAVKKNYEIYCGKIDSDENEYEVSLCLDCFKYKDNNIYLDATDNGW